MTDADKVLVCPKCDGSSVHTAALHDPDKPRYRCRRPDCRHEFDEPQYRQRKQDNTRKGLAGALVDADPEEVFSDD